MNREAHLLRRIHKGPPPRPGAGRSFLPRGLEVAILGGDGAGKTTTIETLQQIWPYPSRRVYMGGLTRLLVAMRTMGRRLAVPQREAEGGGSKAPTPLALRRG